MKPLPTCRCPRCGAILPPQGGDEEVRGWEWADAWPFHQHEDGWVAAEVEEETA